MALDYASRAELCMEENYAKAVLANVYITLEGVNSLKAQMIFEQLPKTKDTLNFDQIDYVLSECVKDVK